MNGDEENVAEAASRFLFAFDNLDWKEFRAAWAPHPSVFFPFEDTPDAVRGLDLILDRFRRFFDEVRTRDPGPPYLQLKPRDLQIEVYGNNGLVTFVLDRPKALDGRPVARRTLLFVRHDGVWKLAHLHASSAGKPQQ